MRTLLFTLVALLSLGSAAGATEVTPRTEAAPNVISAPSSAPAGDVANLNLRKVSVEQRQGSDDAATAQLGPRGGFWWTVGAIVVAVVIVSLIL